MSLFKLKRHTQQKSDNTDKRPLIDKIEYIIIPELSESNELFCSTNGPEPKNTSYKLFSNPDLINMTTLLKQPQWCKTMGELAYTIIEYLDKDIKEPVLLLYPTNQIVSLVPNEDCHIVANVHLTSETRQDLFNQIKFRRKSMERFNNSKRKAY